MAAPATHRLHLLQMEIEMADKKPGRGGHGAPKKKGKKPPKAVEGTPVARKSNKREKMEVRHRLFEGKTVVPVSYTGASAGFGNYTAGMVDGLTIRDQTGRPIPFQNFPLEPKVVKDF